MNILVESGIQTESMSGHSVLIEVRCVAVYSELLAATTPARV
jgi:hypothetical protein